MTNQTQSLEQLIAAAQTKIAEKLFDSAEQLNELPDNPGITQRFGKGFSIKASAFGVTSWSPFYHDWKAQYAQVQHYLTDAMTESNARSALAHIAKHGTDHYQGEKRQYAPEVLEQIQPMLTTTVAALDQWFKPSKAGHSPTP